MADEIVGCSSQTNEMEVSQASEEVDLLQYVQATVNSTVKDRLDALESRLMGRILPLSDLLNSAISAIPTLPSRSETVCTTTREKGEGSKHPAEVGKKDAPELPRQKRKHKVGANTILGPKRMTQILRMTFLI